MRQRSETLERIVDKTFDVCVIGGGATGSGCALDAALRGLTTVLLEASDFSSSASSASTKLIHGGLRYLQQAVTQFDFGQLQLVKRALRERQFMIRNGPHLSRVCRIDIPCFSMVESAYCFIGLKLYDWLSGKARLSPSYFVDRKTSLRKMPWLKADRLLGTVSYEDGQFDDARYNLAIIQSGSSAGAEVLNYVEAIGFERDENGRLVAVTARDRVSGRHFRVASRAFVNATGPFADHVRQLADPSAAPVLCPSKGVHILLPLTSGFGSEALLIPQTEDGRLIFAIPWMGRLLVGTTDTESDPGAAMIVLREEAEYLLRHLNHYLDRPFELREVVSAMAGLRPLVRMPETHDTKSISRDYEIERQPATGLISIMGGKWTVYRAMAENTIDAVEKTLLGGVTECRTREFPLFGAEDESERLIGQLRGAYPIAYEVAAHIVQKFGSLAPAVLTLTNDNPDLLSPITPGALQIKAEVLYCVRQEMALSIEDILARRLGLQLFDWGMAIEAAPAVAEILAQELNWTTAEKYEALKSYVSKINDLQESIGLDQVTEMRARH